MKAWPLVLLVLSTSVFASPHAGTVSAVPVGPTPVYQVDLDANSVSQADANIASSASQKSSFRIGAIINSSNTSPLTGVFAWQFGITYNASAFVPQGEPGSGSYPDGAGSTALFGSQTIPGSVNWAGRIASTTAFGGSTIIPPVTELSTREIVVFWTLLDPAIKVSISANTLLANVNFEIVSKPSTPQSFSITDVIFVDENGTPINGPLAGKPAVETITNEPPHAKFTATPDPSAGPFTYQFNATSTYDLDGAIPNPTGYFWDFGDGTQDLGVTGNVVVHDYGVNSSFVPTLRVQDSQGETGAAKDSAGNIIVDNQPSHARRTIGPPPVDGPIASLSVNVVSPVVDEELIFDGGQSRDPGGSIVQWFWSFGNGTVFFSPEWSGIGDFYYHRPGNYSVTLTVTDNRGYSANATIIVPVHARPLHDVGIFFLEAQPNRLDSSWKTTITIGVRNYGSSDENATITVYNESNIIASLNNLTLPAGHRNIPCSPCYSEYAFETSWNTGGITPANYTVSATIRLPTDPSPSDNTANTPVEILPFQPSTISAEPLKTSPGGWLDLKGSNFPYHQRDNGDFVRITLDGKPVGYARTYSDGTFTFWLFVPALHVGTHSVEAQDVSVGAQASLIIHVVPSTATHKPR